MIPQNKLTNSLISYIEYQSQERLIFKSTLDLISEKLPETVIFGGMVREFALGNARNFSSDIDLVTLASQAEIYQVIKSFSPVKNKYGGFRFIVNKRIYDIWAFEDTWAFREGLLKGNTFSDLFDTTFFNLDSALFHLGRKKCYLSNFYQLSLESKLLEINLEENPFPERMAERAILMAIEKQLFIGPLLASYLLKNKSRSDNLLFNLFIEGLRNHLEVNGNAKYKFNLKNLFLNTLHIPLRASIKL
jgi:hypothetical protein